MLPYFSNMIASFSENGKYFFYFFQTFFVGMKKTPVMAEAITGRPDEFKKGYFA